MKDLRKIAIWTTPVAILIVLVLLLSGCKNPDDFGEYGFNLQSNPRIKVVFTDPIFRQIGFDSNDPYSKYLTEAIGLKYYDQRYIISMMESTVSSIDIASTMVNNPDTASILVGLASRGVKVRVVTEDSNFYFINPTIPAQTRQVQQQLVDSGVRVQTDESDANQLMHERYMIIDNTYLLVGSADFLSSSFSETINNVLIIESIQSLQNPTTATPANVNTLMDAYIFDFEQMFNRKKFGGLKEPLYKNKFEDTGTMIEAYFGPANNVAIEMVNEMAATDEKLFYSVQQFSSNALANVIVQLIQADLNVLGVVDSSSNLDDDSLEMINALEYDGLGYNTLNHKFMAIDFPDETLDYEFTTEANRNDPVVITGSPNFNDASFLQNDENLLIVHDLAVTYMYGMVEFQSNVTGAQQLGVVFGECHSAVNNVPLECTIEIRVERKGFLPGLPDDEPEEADSDAETGFYMATVPGGLTDITVTEAPDGYLLPSYIAGNELIFPGGSQIKNWFLPLTPSGSGSGGGSGGGGPP